MISMDANSALNLAIHSEHNAMREVISQSFSLTILVKSIHCQDILPELSRGKGNKLIHIPSAKALEREEFVIDAQILLADQTLVVHAGKRHVSLKSADLKHYQGERGRRGNHLPRGLQNVTNLEIFNEG